MPKVICPVCGEDFIKPYSHFIKHVKNGEMERGEKIVTTMWATFRPTTGAADALPCGHVAAIVNNGFDWNCAECGQTVRR